MIEAASLGLANSLTDEENGLGLIYPRIERIREISAQIALSVIREAQKKVRAICLFLGSSIRRLTVTCRVSIARLASVNSTMPPSCNTLKKGCGSLKVLLSSRVSGFLFLCFTYFWYTVRLQVISWCVHRGIHAVRNKNWIVDVRSIYVKEWDTPSNIMQSLWLYITVSPFHVDKSIYRESCATTMTTLGKKGCYEINTMKNEGGVAMCSCTNVRAHLSGQPASPGEAGA